MSNKELIEYIVTSLVDRPEEVQLHEIEAESSTVIELRVAKDDIGKVIGKHGRIAKAIRTILSASLGAQDKRVMLEILD